MTFRIPLGFELGGGHSRGLRGGLNSELERHFWAANDLELLIELRIVENFGREIQFRNLN